MDSRRRSSGPTLLPQHTLVLVSTDAGAFGGAGAARFATSSPLAQSAIAVVVLDDLGRGRPRLAIAGDRPVSPARTLVRTAAARITEEVGVSPSLPSVPAQLVDLGVPFALDEQGRFLAARAVGGHAHDGRGEHGADRRAGARNRAARSARPGDRGAHQLARHQPRWSISHARQPLLRRPRRERMDRAPGADTERRTVRARGRRSDRSRSATCSSIQARPARATRATRRMGIRRTARVGRSSRRHPPDRRSAPAGALHGVLRQSARSSVSSFCCRRSSSAGSSRDGTSCGPGRWRPTSDLRASSSH